MSRVARKFQTQGFAQSPAAAATMNLRMASYQLASIGVPPRIQRPQRVHQPRQRLLVQSFPEAAQPVKIRHASQNVGSALNKAPTVIEIPPAQTQLV
jgi:hypothetical protein